VNRTTQRTMPAPRPARPRLKAGIIETLV
jgi:hypothetical protein